MTSPLEFEMYLEDKAAILFSAVRYLFNKEFCGKVIENWKWKGTNLKVQILEINRDLGVELEVLEFEDGGTFEKNPHAICLNLDVFLSQWGYINADR